MLGKDQIAFLNAEDLTEQQAVNICGQPDSDWKRLAIEADEVLLSGSKCKNFGHGITTGSGDCAHCDPAKLAYQQRFTISVDKHCDVRLDQKLLLSDLRS